jgi:hypothetical protein
VIHQVHFGSLNASFFRLLEALPSLAHAVLYVIADHDGAPQHSSAAVAGVTTMLRLSSTIGFALVALASVFATGCIAETNEPEQLIWYDEDFDACFSKNEKGQTVQVPCEEMEMPGLDEASDTGAACTGSACCETRGGNVDDTGYCR